MRVNFGESAMMVPFLSWVRNESVLQSGSAPAAWWAPDILSLGVKQTEHDMTTHFNFKKRLKISKTPRPFPHTLCGVHKEVLSFTEDGFLLYRCNVYKQESRHCSPDGVKSPKHVNAQSSYKPYSLTISEVSILSEETEQYSYREN
jgi:hypothetical protein